MRYQQQVFDMMMLGLRLGDMPRVLIATTPRTTPFMRKLVAGREAGCRAGAPAGPARDEPDPYQGSFGVARKGDARRTDLESRVLHRRGLDQLEAEMMAFSIP
jgi:hypothetical protein